MVCRSHQRLREVLRPSRVEAELDEELRDHFARELEQQQRATESAAAARRQAHLRVGSADVAREAVADGRTGKSFENSCVISVLPVAAFDAIQAWRQQSCCRSRWASEGPPQFSAWSMPCCCGLWRIQDRSAPRGPGVVEELLGQLVARRLSGPSRTEPSRLAHVGAYYLPDGGFALATPAGPEVVEGGFVTTELPRVLGVTPIVGAASRRSAGRAKCSSANHCGVSASADAPTSWARISRSRGTHSRLSA